MVKGEEQARQHFRELKDILPKLSPRWWKKDFKHHVDKFIGDLLIQKEMVTEPPCKNEEEELHELRRLVAGADREWELVQQPKHAAMCAMMD